MTKYIAFLSLVTLAALCAAQGVVAQEIELYGKLRHSDGDVSVSSVAFSPDRKLLAVGYDILEGARALRNKKGGAGGTLHGEVILWDVATRKAVVTLECGGFVQVVAFSPDGKLLAAAFYDDNDRLSKVRVTDVASREVRFTFCLDDRRGSVYPVAFSPGGKTLVIGTGSRPAGPELIIVDLATGKEKAALKGGSLIVSSLSFNADGKLLTSVSDDVVQVWDMITEKQRNSFPVGRGHKAAMSPDGSAIAISTIGSRKYSGIVGLTLRDAETGKERIDFKCIQTGAAVLFTSDGKRLIYGYGHGLIKVWDPATGEALATIDGPNFNCLAITADSKLIASGNLNGTVWLWDLSSLPGTRK